MKKLIIKKLTVGGNKSKMYIIDYKDAVIFHQYRLYSPGKFSTIIGGERIIKETKNYILTYHWFAIRKSTLQEVNQYCF